MWGTYNAVVHSSFSPIVFAVSMKSNSELLEPNSFGSANTDQLDDPTIRDAA
jgi:hypothetical protein